MRRILPVIVLFALAASAAACDASFTPYAAKVNGQTISETAAKSDFDQVAANADLRCLIESNGAVYGAGSGTYSAAFAASELTQWITLTVVDAELVRRHISVSSLAQSTARSDAVSAFDGGTSSTCPATGAATVASFSPALAQSVVGGEAAVDALKASLGGEPLTPAGVAAFATAHPAAATEHCISWIVTTSEATARRLATSIAQGASFAVVAKASSIDTGTAANGGAVGCYAAVNLPPPLDTLVPSLALGSVSSPTAISENGSTYYLLVKVTSRKTSTAAATEALIANGGSEEEKILQRLLAAADVEINPAFGHWTKVNGSYEVATSSGPPLKYLGNVGAITPIVSP
jgi:hypothetical protein